MIIQPKTPAIVPDGMVRVGALWTWERIDKKSGRVIGIEQAHNLAPAEGRNALLDIMFHGATQINPWYVLLFSSDYIPLDADTYAVPGFTEFQAYNEATRPEFVEAAASGGICSNSASRAIFTMTVESMIYGSALVGGGGAASTKGDVAGGGTLFSSVRMGTPALYPAAEVIRVTATITVVSA
jgi:hypothetical protein